MIVVDWENVVHEPSYYCRGVLAFPPMAQYEPWRAWCPCGWKQSSRDEEGVYSATREHRELPPYDVRVTLA